MAVPPGSELRQALTSLPFRISQSTDEQEASPISQAEGQPLLHCFEITISLPGLSAAILISIISYSSN